MPWCENYMYTFDENGNFLALRDHWYLRDHWSDDATVVLPLALALHLYTTLSTSYTHANHRSLIQCWNKHKTSPEFSLQNTSKYFWRQATVAVFKLPAPVQNVLLFQRENSGLTQNKHFKTTNGTIEVGRSRRRGIYYQHII